MTRSKSSRRWLKQHVDDPFVQQARAAGYRSRAVFKLEELQRKHLLIRPGSTVVDLGAAPGGWSQFAAELTGPQGRVIALDILPMSPVPGVEFIQGDFQEASTLQRLLDALQGRRADLVISDMAPNISGISAVDQPRAMALAELALELACDVLRPGGGFVIKLFQGEGFDAFVRTVRESFRKVRLRKPDSSRAKSREVYLVGLHSVATGRNVV